ncbi:S8 family serine peptidase [Kitasatospora sp. NPDC052896]|uniref:S8 family serine peptidase n=1 Tax=Kitasatospora sp. NPDC052896 TaxID=3364061 RepID=UPI0037C90624
MAAKTGNYSPSYQVVCEVRRCFKLSRIRLSGCCWWRAASVSCAPLIVAFVWLASNSAIAEDCYRSKQWALSAFNVDVVWKVSTGVGVVVGVLDSGVDSGHPDLVGQALPGISVIQGGGLANVADNFGHGTRISGLIAAKGHGPDGSQGVKGLSPGAKILPVKLSDGDSTYGPGNPLARGIRYAVDHGAKVINISALLNVLGQPERDALQYAHDKDVIVVVGIGQTATENDIGLPAFPGVVSVGGVDQNGELWRESNSSRYLTLLAPAVGIVSTAPHGAYSQADGTSDATAYVSAAAALVRARFPHLTAGQVVNRLIRSAGLPPSVQGAHLALPDPRLGYGFVRPYSALTMDIDPGPAAGPLPQPAGTPTPAPTASPGRPGTAFTAGATTLALGGLLGAAYVVIRRRREVHRSSQSSRSSEEPS